MVGRGLAGAWYGGCNIVWNVPTLVGIPGKAHDFGPNWFLANQSQLCPGLQAAAKIAIFRCGDFWKDSCENCKQSQVWRFFAVFVMLMSLNQTELRIWQNLLKLRKIASLTIFRVTCTCDFSQFTFTFIWANFAISSNSDIRTDDVFHIRLLIRCKTVRIFAYSSSREQPYPKLHRFWKKTQLFRSLLRHLHISHNTPCLFPPKHTPQHTHILDNLYFSFLQGFLTSEEKTHASHVLWPCATVLCNPCAWHCFWKSCFARATISKCKYYLFIFYEWYRISNAWQFTCRSWLDLKTECIKGIEVNISN